MRKWLHGSLFMVAALSLSMAARAAELTSGRWKLEAGGQPLMILELRAPSTNGGEWTGTLTGPQHFSFSSGVPLVFTNVHGPVQSKVMVDTHPLADRLEFMIAGDEDRTIYVWRPDDATHGELSFTGFDAAPQPFTEAGGNETVGKQWDADQSYAVEYHWPSNPEMAAIFKADQDDREGGPNVDWAAVGPRDVARRARTKALLDSGALKSGDDFWRAAFIFQHGSEPRDYLLAHTLALVAAARGRPDATWIAAATLDRYLQNIGQKQIYGTQYQWAKDQPPTQEPYDRTLISDELRSSLGVPALAAQEERRKAYEAKQRVTE